MGTVMVYQAACRFLGVKPEWSHEAFMPPPDVPELAVDGRSDAEETVLGELVGKVYDIEADDRRFRAAMSDDGTVRAAAFDRLRKEYPKRREFHGTSVSVRDGDPSLWSKISGLGFRAA
jgi:erythronate-4-phosphate dehydrogenase